MVNAAFAEANGFVIGDVFHANINGQRRALTITGTALSRNSSTRSAPAR
jgi:putative ABC transport system permease protein